MSSHEMSRGPDEVSKISLEPQNAIVRFGCVLEGSGACHWSQTQKFRARKLVIGTVVATENLVRDDGVRWLC